MITIDAIRILISAVVIFAISAVVGYMKGYRSGYREFKEMEGLIDSPKLPKATAVVRPSTVESIDHTETDGWAD